MGGDLFDLDGQPSRA